MIMTFQTQLANDPDALKYTDIFKDMQQKVWKNRTEKIEQNLETYSKFKCDHVKDIQLYYAEFCVCTYSRTRWRISHSLCIFSPLVLI